MTRKLTTVGDIVALLRDLNVRIVQASLDPGSKGTVTKCCYGYLIFVEETLSFDAMLRTLKHELCHILLNHLDDDTKTVAQKEQEVKQALKGV